MFSKVQGAKPTLQITILSNQLKTYFFRIIFFSFQITFISFFPRIKKCVLCFSSIRLVRLTTFVGIYCLYRMIFIALLMCTVCTCLQEIQTPSWREVDQSYPHPPPSGRTTKVIVYNVLRLSCTLYIHCTPIKINICHLK